MKNGPKRANIGQKWRKMAKNELKVGKMGSKVGKTGLEEEK